MSTTFAQLGLPKPLVDALTQRGLTDPFPVQAATIPDALKGKDVCGMAPTGSGKTLAFGLPLLSRVARADRNRPRALVLAPTRELAEQILRELSPLAKAASRSITAIYGGVGYGPQKNALRRGADVVVATPGRLEDLMEQRAVDLGSIEIVVLDEADRMADMGFFPAMRRILEKTPSSRQTLLFSATLDGDVGKLTRDYQRDPVRHEATSTEADHIDAIHHFWLVDRQKRARHAADVIESEGSSIVFTRTRHGADRLAKQLGRFGIDAVPIHGGRSQSQRTRALKEFTTGRARALIATDVVARGIHVDAVASVIHFDVAGDAKDYLHRSGRTARAGAGGTVVSLVTADQRREVKKMQREAGIEAPIEAPRLDALGSMAKVRPVQADDLRSRRRPERAEPVSQETNGDAESVYVANLPWTATSQDLDALFGTYGEVRESTIITNRSTGRSKGFGFVEMPTKAARDAVSALNGSEMGGRDLTVKMARPRSQSRAS